MPNERFVHRHRVVHAARERLERVVVHAREQRATHHATGAATTTAGDDEAFHGSSL
jgi:hypothetical protein